MGRLSPGREGENLAVDYLLKKGYKILEKNFRCSFGEIDIIAKDGNFIVIVEVKRRMSDKYGEPEFAVNHKKQKKTEEISPLLFMQAGQRGTLKI